MVGVEFSWCSTFYRNQDGLTRVDLAIATMTILDPQDTTSVKNSVQEAMNGILTDGVVGEHNVTPLGYLEISSSEIGTYVHPLGTKGHMSAFG